MKSSVLNRIEQAESELKIRKPVIVVDWHDKITDEQEKQLKEENPDNIVLRVKWAK